MARTTSRWVGPEEVLPGHVVNLNGGGRTMEVEEVVPLLDLMGFDEARVQLPEGVSPHDVIILRGWVTDAADPVESWYVDNCRHLRGRKRLWLVTSLRDLIAYDYRRPAARSGGRPAVPPHSRRICSTAAYDRPVAVRLPDLVLYALATARLTRLLTADKITEPVRDRIRAHLAGRPRLLRHATYLLGDDQHDGCAWCASIWIAAAAAPVAWRFGRHPAAAIPATALALSQLTGMISRWGRG